MSEGPTGGRSETEACVTERDQVASGKQREAAEVLAVAQAVADGNLDCEEQGEEVGSTQELAPGKSALAKRLFAKALARLRNDERAEARTELKGAFDEVRKADDAIVRIANLLPVELRKQIAAARKSLAHNIAALGSQIRGKAMVEKDASPRE